MRKARKQSRILKEVREAARDLQEIGLIDGATVRRFDALWKLGPKKQ